MFESSTPKGSRSSTNASEGETSIGEKIKNTLARLERSGTKNSTTKKNYNLIVNLLHTHLVSESFENQLL